METAYKLIADLAKELVPPDTGIKSQTLFASDRLKAVGFAFAAGEELSEHTAAFPAVLQVLSGEGEVTLGSDRHAVTAGAWAHMPAKLPHSVKATTPMTMLLLLLKS